MSKTAMRPVPLLLLACSLAACPPWSSAPQPCAEPLERLCDGGCPGFDEVLEQQLQDANATAACDGGLGLRITAGTCGDRRFVSRGGGFEVNTWVFAADGGLLMKRRFADAAGFCNRTSFSIRHGPKVECEPRVVTLERCAVPRNSDAQPPLAAAIEALRARQPPRPVAPPTPPTPARTVSVRTGAGAFVGQRGSHEEVRKALAAHHPEIARCFQQAPPGPSSDFRLRWTIRASGFVSDVSVTGGSPAQRRCLSRAVELWTFEPRPEAAAVLWPLEISVR